MNASQKPWLSIIALTIGACIVDIKNQYGCPAFSSKRTIL
ncbi:Uncharacterised protein [Neisseria meningitidis]|nr:Uncharacterised protein [Neisseria meningitidis]